MRDMALETTSIYLPADGEASWLLLPSSISLLLRGTVQLSAAGLFKYV